MSLKNICSVKLYIFSFSEALRIYFCTSKIFYNKRKKLIIISVI